eukprot:TRINITY_DN344_c0_g2_i2.p1 TRINITY_DN344_c0_g2~~TRINITY_DN344_c0_g2_i2.p1  ORF type:complete len:180 (+),score=27.56 TRINITY_DN344_c0_g2_i2:63-602(+)
MPLVTSRRDFSSVEVTGSYNELLPIAAELVENLLVEGTGRDGGTVFDGSKDAGISVKDYFVRLVKYGKCSRESFIVVLIYLDRFTNITNRELTTRNIHRLLLATFTVAVKLRDDVFYLNSYYATVGGVTLRDLNIMEHQLLTTLNWDLHITGEEYRKYTSTLERVKLRRELKAKRASRT